MYYGFTSSWRSFLFKKNYSAKINILQPSKRLFSEMKNEQTKLQLNLKSVIQKSGENPQNITKDNILYQCDQTKFFRIMNFFAITQFGFWTYLGINISYLKSVKIPNAVKNDKDLPWWRKYDVAYYKNPMTCVAFFIGK